MKPKTPNCQKEVRYCKLLYKRIIATAIFLITIIYIYPHMARLLLQGTVVLLSTAAIVSVNSPRAHASWVSHWLGLDHHTSAPTPTPTPIIQVVYPQPTTIVVTAPYFSQTPLPAAPPVIVYAPTPVVSHTPYSSSAPYTSNSTASLPVTGPETTLFPIAALFALAIPTIVYLRARSRLHTTLRTIDVV